MSKYQQYQKYKIKSGQLLSVMILCWHYCEIKGSCRGWDRPGSCNTTKPFDVNSGKKLKIHFSLV